MKTNSPKRAKHRPATKRNQPRASRAEAQKAKTLVNLIGPEVAAEVIAQAKAEGEGIENFVTDAMSHCVFQAQEKTNAGRGALIFKRNKAGAGAPGNESHASRAEARAVASEGSKEAFALMALERLVSPQRLKEAKEAAALRGWPLTMYLDHVLECAAMADGFAREAGCQHWVAVPLQDEDVQSILKRYDPERRQRIDQILRGWALEKLAADTASKLAATPAGDGGTKTQGAKGTSVFLDIEDAQQKARGLLRTLSDALGATDGDEQGAVGLSVVADDLAQKVDFHWRELCTEWSKQREVDCARLESLAVMPQELRAAFENMTSPLQTAAACVHAMAMALKQHAEVRDTFHARGVTDGYDELAVYWSSEILLPIDRLMRPEIWNVSREVKPAGSPAVAA